MNNKLTLILTLCFFSGNFIIAQTSSTDELMAVSAYNNDFTQSLVNVYGVSAFDFRNKEVKGDRYLDEGWHSGDIQFVNRSAMSDVDFLYDLVDQRLILKYKSRVFRIPLVSIREFSFEDKLAVEKDQRSFVKLEVDGKVVLMEKLIEVSDFVIYNWTKAELLKANYNHQLHVGSYNDQIKTTNKYFLSQNGKLTELPKKKGKASKVFRNNSKLVDCIYSSGPDFKDVEYRKQLTSCLEQI